MDVGLGIERGSLQGVEIEKYRLGNTMIVSIELRVEGGEVCLSMTEEQFAAGLRAANKFAEAREKTAG